MHFVIALIVGGVIGWVASMIMNRDASMGIAANVFVGCVGSILGRFLLGLFGLGGGRLTVNAFNPMTIVSALIGAVVLLGIVNLVRRGKVR